MEEVIKMIATLGYGYLALVAESIFWEWKAAFFTMLIDALFMYFAGAITNY